MDIQRMSGILASILLIIIFSSLIHLEIDYNFKDFIINNVFAIKNATCSPNDIHCIPLGEFSDAECKDGFDNDEDGKTDSEDPDCGFTISAPSENNKPKANAGTDQTVKSGDQVQLDGTQSYDPDCNGNGNSNDCEEEIEYDWQQTGGGPKIKDWEGVGVYDAEPSFIAPSVDKSTKVTIVLKVYDQYQWSDPDKVIITVKPTVEVPSAGNQLGIKIHVEKNQINFGEEQTITVTAFNKSSNEKVVGSTIEGKVTFHNRDIEIFSGNDGEATLSWNIDPNSSAGTFKVAADASAKGYKSISDSTSFKVVKKVQHKGGDPTGGDPTGGDPTGSGPLDGTTTRIGLIAIMAVAAIVGIYGKHRSSKRHPQSHVEVITRGGIE